MKVYIETFGCTFNQGDSQIMAGLLKENNAEIVNVPEGCRCDNSKYVLC